MAFKKINDLIQIYPKKKIRERERDCLVCSCAINKKLSTPYDFYECSVCDVIREGVKNPLKPRVLLRLLPTITQDLRRAGRNEIIFECDPSGREERQIYSEERILNGLLFGTIFDD